MTANASRVRRARVAIFGPLVAGVAGVLLIAGGAIGSAFTDVGTAQVGSPTPAPPAAPAVEEPATQGAFILVGADGQVYALGDLGQPRLATSTPGEKSPAAPPKEPIIGAAGASTGGMWLATATGRVYASTAPSLGNASLSKNAAPIVGIAATVGGRGYRLAASDGRVYDFGAKPVARSSAVQHALAEKADIVGIATAANGGYWLAHRNGAVTAVGTRALGHLTVPAHAASVVGIAATSDATGYWLVTADGRVHAFGAPSKGDLAHSREKARIVGIAPSGDDGYWLAAADGTVYAFGAPTFAHDAGAEPSAPIVAILPY